MSFETGAAYNANTILDDGSGQRAGLIGEMAFAEGLAEHRISYRHIGGEKSHHDFIVGDVKIDVKAKQRNVPPSINYDAHVTTSNRDFDCRLYVFASITDGAPTLMGWMGKEEFWSNATIVSKGDLDEQGWAVRSNSGRLKYSQLRPMDDLWRRLIKEG